MPSKIATAEEFERLTGSRGSVYIGPTPKRPKPKEKTQPDEAPKPDDPERRT